MFFCYLNISKDICLQHYLRNIFIFSGNIRNAYERIAFIVNVLKDSLENLLIRDPEPYLQSELSKVAISSSYNVLF